MRATAIIFFPCKEGSLQLHTKVILLSRRRITFFGKIFSSMTLPATEIFSFCSIIARSVFSASFGFSIINNKERRKRPRSAILRVDVRESILMFLGRGKV